MIHAQQISTLTVALSSTKSVDLAILMESESNLVFALEASYLEQQAGTVTSPYEDHGAVRVDESDPACDGLAHHPDYLRETLTDHPQWPKRVWREEVAQGVSELGYYEWLSQKLTHHDII